MFQRDRTGWAFLGDASELCRARDGIRHRPAQCPLSSGLFLAPLLRGEPRREGNRVSVISLSRQWRLRRGEVKHWCPCLGSVGSRSAERWGSGRGGGESPGKADPEPRETGWPRLPPQLQTLHLRVGGCAVISRLPPSAVRFGTGLGAGASYQDAHRGCLLRYPDRALPLAPLEILCFRNSFQGWAPVLHVA